MVKYINECVNCELPCSGHSCPYWNVPHFYCDECKEEIQLYEYENCELCLECIEKKLNKVNY